MNYQEFRDLVAKMRGAQKEYFKTKNKNYLEYSKSIEKLVDEELAKDNQLFNI